MSSIIVVKLPRLKQPKPQKSRKKYGGRKGMALPTFLNCLAINELMTFWIFLAKSCYWNSFLLSFQDYLLLFTFFNHYINMGVFIPLIHCHHCLYSMDKRGGGEEVRVNPRFFQLRWEVACLWSDRYIRPRVPKSYFFVFELSHPFGYIFNFDVQPFLHISHHCRQLFLE